MPYNKIEGIRSQILELTEEYAKNFLNPIAFTASKDPIPVSGKVLGSDDFVNLIDSSLDGWFTSGRYTKESERSLADFVGVRSALFVNSGSSANLCALSGLTSKKLGERALKKGDEVLTVAMGFPTTVNPIIQNGLKQLLLTLL